MLERGWSVHMICVRGVTCLTLIFSLFGVFTCLAPFTFSVRNFVTALELYILPYFTNVKLTSSCLKLCASCFFLSSFQFPFPVIIYFSLTFVDFAKTTCVQTPRFLNDAACSSYMICTFCSLTFPTNTTIYTKFSRIWIFS